MHDTNQAHSAHITCRRRRRHRAGPDGYLTAAQVAQRADAALSTVYHWIATGRLGKPHRWRHLLVVDQRTADEFLLAVRPVHAAAADGGQHE